MSDNGEAALANGTMIKDRYRIVRLLGAGGMGAVYEARDNVLDKRVALKILHADIANDEQMTARFIQEARSASAFKHRNVVESLDFGSHDGAPFLVMEFLEGEAFADVLQRDKTISPERAVSLLEPIARALARAHLAGIIHRDVKPDNVFLAKGDDGECVPKLVDFGIAKRTTEGELRLTKTSVAMGTPFYMPPEQAMGARDVTPAADQYAFAVMLFEAVSGKFPHDGESYNALIINKVTKEPLALRDASPEINDRFATVVMKALSREPQGRYASMAELRDALVESLGGRVDSPSMVDAPAAATAPASRDTATAKERPAITKPNSVNESAIATPDTRVVTAVGPAIPADSVAGVERPSELSPAPARARSSAGPLIGVATLVVALIAGGGYAFSQRGSSNAATGSTHVGTQNTAQTPTPPARRTLRVRVVPAGASIQVDGRDMGRGAASYEAQSGAEVELRFAADGHVTRVERVRLDSDQNIERVLEALPSQPTAQVAADAGAASAAQRPNAQSNGRPSGRGRPAQSSSGGVQLGRTGVRLDLSLTPPPH